MVRGSFEIEDLKHFQASRGPWIWRGPLSRNVQKTAPGMALRRIISIFSSKPALLLPPLLSPPPPPTTSLPCKNASLIPENAIDNRRLCSPFFTDASFRSQPVVVPLFVAPSWDLANFDRASLWQC